MHHTSGNTSQYSATNWLQLPPLGHFQCNFEIDRACGKRSATWCKRGRVLLRFGPLTSKDDKTRCHDLAKQERTCQLSPTCFKAERKVKDISDIRGDNEAQFIV